MRSTVRSLARRSAPSSQRRIEVVGVPAVRSLRSSVPSITLSMAAVPSTSACAAPGARERARGVESDAQSHGRRERRWRHRRAARAHDCAARRAVERGRDRVGWRVERRAPQHVARGSVVRHRVRRRAPGLGVDAGADDRLCAWRARRWPARKRCDGARRPARLRMLARHERDVEDRPRHGARADALGRHARPDAQPRVRGEQQPRARLAHLERGRQRACSHARARASGRGAWAHTRRADEHQRARARGAEKGRRPRAAGARARAPLTAHSSRVGVPACA